MSRRNPSQRRREREMWDQIAHSMRLSGREVAPRKSGIVVVPATDVAVRPRTVLEKRQFRFAGRLARWAARGGPKRQGTDEQRRGHGLFPCWDPRGGCPNVPLTGVFCPEHRARSLQRASNRRKR